MNKLTGSTAMAVEIAALKQKLTTLRFERDALRRQLEGARVCQRCWSNYSGGLRFQKDCEHCHGSGVVIPPVEPATPATEERARRNLK